MHCLLHALLDWVRAPTLPLSTATQNSHRTFFEPEPPHTPSHATPGTRCIYLKILHSMCSRPSMVASSAIMSSTRAFCFCTGQSHAACQPCGHLVRRAQRSQHSTGCSVVVWPCAFPHKVAAGKLCSMKRSRRRHQGT